MQIQVQLFSILRDCLPPDSAHGSTRARGQATLTLPDGVTLADLVTLLGIDERLGFGASEVVTKAGWQVTVSGKFESDMTRTLQDGDEVLIFPPISGG